MNATLINVQYSYGQEPVCITLVHPFGHVHVNTTQTDLASRTSPPGGVWDDPEVIAAAQEGLDSQFPGYGFVAVAPEEAA